MKKPPSPPVGKNPRKKDAQLTKNAPVERPKAKKPPQPGKRQVPVSKKPAMRSSRLGNFLTGLGALVALVGAAGLIVGGGNLAVQSIVNPDSIVWLNRYLPSWTRIPVAVREPPLTLAQIRAAISKKQLTSGEPISLNDSDLLLPIKAKRKNCQSDCEQIVELRVYQSAEVVEGEKAYRLVSQAAISGPEEASVIPKQTTESDRRNSTRSLALTQVSSIQGEAPELGVWLNVTGIVAAEKPIVYGQVIHYNPSQTHLSIMAAWTSQTGESAYWEEITGGDSPELVVNQTVGVEPQFRVYQVKPRNFVPDPVDLEEVSLTDPAINTKAYRNGLLLARNGLWSPALSVLKSVKNKEKWSSDAQAQLDVIQYHAQITQAEAKKPWASPSDQIVATLIDGRWREAIALFESLSDPRRYEVAMSLKSDSRHLWKRVEAALKVDPSQNDAQAWGALIMAAQQGRAKAIAWLQQQTPSTPVATAQAVAPLNSTEAKIPEQKPQSTPQITQLLDLLDAAFAYASPISSHFSQIIGTAQPLTVVNPAEWLRPDETAPLQQEGQQWYQVQVANFHDGQRWLKQPFTDVQLSTVEPGKQLWKLLGLDTDPRIQITVWKPDGQQQTTMAVVKGAQVRDGAIALLATGEALSSPAPANASGDRLRPMAHTEKALQWLQADSTSLGTLSQIQPQWTYAILPTLWRELQKAGQIPPGAIPSLPAMLQALGNWSVQPIDLTGNNQPEAVLTLYQDVSAALKPKDGKPAPAAQIFKPRTLIFSDTGSLIYSEFSADTGASLAAIADLGDGGTAALVVEDVSNYSLKRWSAQRQKFE